MSDNSVVCQPVNLLIVEVVIDSRPYPEDTILQSLGTYRGAFGLNKLESPDSFHRAQEFTSMQ